VDASKHDPHTVDYIMCTWVGMKKSEKTISRMLREREWIVDADER